MLDFSLLGLWMSQSVVCPQQDVILYHVAISCKGPIANQQTPENKDLNSIGTYSSQLSLS